MRGRNRAISAFICKKKEPPVTPLKLAAYQPVMKRTQQNNGTAAEKVVRWRLKNVKRDMPDKRHVAAGAIKNPTVSRIHRLSVTFHFAF